MWELDHKEGWEPKNWCFWTVVLEKTLESPLDSKEIKLVNPKGNQAWIFVGRTDAEAEAPILCPPDAKNWLLGKDPDAGKDKREKKRATEDEMIGWHHRLNGYESEHAPGDSEGQGSLSCYSPRGHKESNRTEQQQQISTPWMAAAASAACCLGPGSRQGGGQVASSTPGLLGCHLSTDSHIFLTTMTCL